MKKNKYLKPTIEIIENVTEELLSGSLGVNSDKGLDYGGVDEEGVIVPSSKQRGLWE